MQDLADRKSSLRLSAAVARNGARHALPDAGAALCRHFLAAALVSGPTVISGYCPIRSEIDSIPLMRALHEAGHRLCVPVIEAAGRPLRFREWSPDSAMEVGPFGASVPAKGDWLEPAVLLVPLLAWDARGYRLGYGGGFYDRTLERLRALRPTLAVGLAYSAQRVDEVPTDATDQRLDAVATEAGIHHVTTEASA